MSEHRTIPVEGMTCGGCEQSIQTAVGQLDGVQSVNADHSAGSIQIDFDDTVVDEAAIRGQIEEAGFSIPA